MKKIFCSLFFLLAPAFGFAGVVAGTVADAIGIVLEGVSVKLYQGITEIDSTQTLSDGGYVLNVPDVGLYQLEFSLYPLLTQIVSVNFSTADTTILKDVFFPVTTNTSVTVDVTDLSSVPIVGATVLLLQGGFVYGSGVTDSSGSITINGLSIGISTTIQIDNSLNQIFRELYDTTLLSSSFTFELSSGSLGTISGTVTTSEGNAVGALVECYNSSSNPIASTTTLFDGTYSFSNLPSGSFEIVATLASYQKGIAYVNLSEGGTTTGVDITLPSYGATIVGTVYNIDTGLPIQGATLQLTQNQIVLGVFSTDQFGAFVFANCPSGDLVVNALSPSYQGLSQGITLDSGGVGSLNFGLSSGAFNISGTVESDGVPIDFATVTVSIGSSNQSFTNTTGQGTFTLNNLSVGSFGITATKDGYQSVTIPIEITSSNNQSLAFNLSPLPITLSGQVTDGVTADPIAKVFLQASLDGNLVGSATTDDNGNYAFYNLPSGEVVVWTNYPTSQQVSYTFDFLPGQLPASHNFLLPTGSNILSGFVYDAITYAPIPYAIVFLNQSSNIIPITRYCGPSGEFSFSGLNEDSYSVRAQQSGYHANETDLVTFLGLNENIIQDIYLYPENAPPRNISGATLINNYGAGVVSKINQITWETSASPLVVGYNVYKNGVFVGNVLSSDPLQFNDNNQNSDALTTYAVESVNSDGSLSSTIGVIL